MVYYGVVGWAICCEDEDEEMKMKILRKRKQQSEQQCGEQQ